MEIKVLKDILGANEQMAERNRELLDSKNIFAVNLMASPGAGKTSLVLATIKGLEGKARVGVIEGDVSSSLDAELIGKEGVPVVQINTGGECHLEANMVGKALANLPLADIDLLLIENVGNLICPAEFNLGENKKVVISSIPEGDDKLKKYLTEQVTALINVPLLRDHNIAGVSIGLKNISHGTIANPWNFHDNNCDPYIADINALPVIKEKRKLTICNALRAVFENGPDAHPLWTWNFGALFLSTDPVALDAVGLRIITDKRREKGRPPLERVGRPPTYIRTAKQRGLGEADSSSIEWLKKEV